MQHGLKEAALTSTVLSVLRLQPHMQRHWFLSLFLSLETALDKVRASRSVLPWLPGPQLCVVGHIKAFTEDGQKRGIFGKRKKMCTERFYVIK